MTLQSTMTENTIIPQDLNLSLVGNLPNIVVTHKMKDHLGTCLLYQTKGDHSTSGLENLIACHADFAVCTIRSIRSQGPNNPDISIHSWNKITSCASHNLNNSCISTSRPFSPSICNNGRWKFLSI